MYSLLQLNYANSSLIIQERGYGVAKGIPTLVIAAASMDDVLAISAFTILLGVTFTDGESTDIVSLVFKVILI